MGKNKIEFFPEQFYGFAGRTLQLAPDASTVGCMFRVSHDYERANATFLGNGISKAGPDGQQRSFRSPL